jgi:hypothetical protein
MIKNRASGTQVHEQKQLHRSLGVTSLEFFNLSSYLQPLVYFVIMYVEILSSFFSDQNTQTPSHSMGF